VCVVCVWCVCCVCVVCVWCVCGVCVLCVCVVCVWCVCVVCVWCVCGVCVCVISCNNSPLRLQSIDRTGNTKKEKPTNRWKIYYLVNYFIFWHCSSPVFWAEQYVSDRIVSVSPRRTITRQNLKEANLTFHITISLGGRKRFSSQYAVFG
jgi:hypothetical protein